MALEHGVPILSVHSMLHIRERGYRRRRSRTMRRRSIRRRNPNLRSGRPPSSNGRARAYRPQLNQWLDAISQRGQKAPTQNWLLRIENRGENHDGIELQYLDDTGRLRRLAEEWDLSIALDIAHAASHGADLIDSIVTCLPRLANVHLSDARTRRLPRWHSQRPAAVIINFQEKGCCRSADVVSGASSWPLRRAAHDRVESLVVAGMLAACRQASDAACNRSGAGARCAGTSVTRSNAVAAALRPYSAERKPATMLDSSGRYRMRYEDVFRALGHYIDENGSRTSSSLKSLKGF